jgi:peptidoglycan/xylan/chitin deacetylase (PgdA/CDA1 family)
MRHSLRRGACAAAAGLVLAVAALGCGGSGSSSGPTQTAGAVSIGRDTARVGLRRTRSVELLVPPANPVARSVHVPILTWHRVHLFATELTKSIPDETVEPSVFASEIAALADNGYHAISQRQLYRALFDGARLPPKPVLLTVDDGYIDDVTNILPVLKAHHMVATFYIITGRFHEPGFLDQTQVRELDAAGMDVGAHTRMHVPLNAIPTGDMKNEIIGSRNDLERVLGHPVQWFAYPFGEFSQAVVDEVRRAGFVLAMTTQGGTVESSLAPLTMPRIHVGRAQTAAGLLACVSATAGICGGGGE